MKGVQFVVDEKGEMTSLLIDVHEVSEEWQDFIDGIIAESRLGEPTTSWKDFEAELDKKNGDGLHA